MRFVPLLLEKCSQLVTFRERVEMQAAFPSIQHSLQVADNIAAFGGWTGPPWFMGRLPELWELSTSSLLVAHKKHIIFGLHQPQLLASVAPNHCTAALSACCRKVQIGNVGRRQEMFWHDGRGFQQRNRASQECTANFRIYFWIGVASMCHLSFSNSTEGTNWVLPRMRFLLHCQEAAGWLLKLCSHI